MRTLKPKDLALLAQLQSAFPAGESFTAYDMTAAFGNDPKDVRARRAGCRRLVRDGYLSKTITPHHEAYCVVPEVLLDDARRDEAISEALLQTIGTTFPKGHRLSLPALNGCMGTVAEALSVPVSWLRGHYHLAVLRLVVTGQMLMVGESLVVTLDALT